MELTQGAKETPCEGERPRSVWLVTGATGFLGRHVLSALGDLRHPGIELVAMGRRRPSGWPREAFVEADLVDPWSVTCAIRTARPSVVIHAAGRTPPASALELYYANTVATALLLDALRERDRPVRVVLAGSAAELGPVEEDELPARESHPCRPVEPYGLSKWLATTAGLAARSPLEVMVGRIFNPIGPGTPESQALGRFAALLADPAQTELSVGNLDGRRDFIDVRDASRALIALALHGRPGQVYHIGTGRSHRVREGLDRLLELSGRRVRVESDPARSARNDPRDSRAAIARISEDTGWTPQIAWEQSLNDLWIEACRQAAQPAATATARAAETRGISPCA